jgi:hypothetical protein
LNVDRLLTLARRRLLKVIDARSLPVQESAIFAQPGTRRLRSILHDLGGNDGLVDYFPIFLTALVFALVV